MKWIAALAVALAGCAGTGPDGKWTPKDTASVVDTGFGVVDRSLQTYDRVVNPWRYPIPYAPVLPPTMVPPAPITAP